MCQISVYITKEGNEELFSEDVTNLSIEENGVQVGTLFEGQKHVDGAILRSIDFMAGKVLLAMQE